MENAVARSSKLLLNLFKFIDCVQLALGFLSYDFKNGIDDLIGIRTPVLPSLPVPFID